MDIKPIKSDQDYRRVLLEIERLMDATMGTPDGDRLALATLTTAWEEEHFPIESPNLEAR